MNENQQLIQNLLNSMGALSYGENQIQVNYNNYVVVINVDDTYNPVIDLLNQSILNQINLLGGTASLD